MAMLGKVSPRSSSHYLYLWRQCVQLHRPCVAHVACPRAPLPSTPSGLDTNHKCFSTSVARGLQQDRSDTVLGHGLAPPLEVLSVPQQATVNADPQSEHNQENRRSEQSRKLTDLPTLCPGCGAHSQTIDAASPGFYDITRARHAYGKEGLRASELRRQEDEVYQSMLQHVRAHQNGDQPSTPVSTPSVATIESAAIAPICDRCHELRFHSRGQSIVHPSMQSIQAIIEESPHKHNHIYHVLDAADFPMSLIPNLQHALNLPRLRTQNRRSKTLKYIRGRVAEVSFIITRSDLLAPKKEQVDTMMPYLQEVLRDALGRTNRNVRLGNVRCVSAKRGWWTKNVKEEIYSRGGAGWMVGKVNVGKSALFEVVYPKGRNQEDVNIDRLRHQAAKQAVSEEASHTKTSEDEENDFPREGAGAFQESELRTDDKMNDDVEDVFAEEGSLLPPAQPETAYPVMPLVSSLPGTTASPIRIPFGNGKGELIDLPGVHRSTLEQHVKDEHRKEMIMKHRIVPEQYTLRSGQSLLLGGLIRITHKAGDHIILAYPFVPSALEPHVTGNHKAIAIQTGMHSLESRGREGQDYTGNVPSIATDAAKKTVKSAGSFQVQWNVTKRRAGPLTDRAAGKQKADDLPFVIYSADLLIEGVGWVELACQVRRRPRTEPRPLDSSRDALSFMDSKPSVPSDLDAPQLPEVEVFSPEGKYVGVRRPMNAWVIGGPKSPPAHLKRVRPRMSISMTKRRQPARAT